ncbi:atlastin-1-like isoform X1 [Clavelina lepadiformis]|uniref:atlastin-1-like isoform X1 n=2 Tax=Clavelina lepadiformis TaxID=159417 RepID=UPI004043591B
MQRQLSHDQTVVGPVHFATRSGHDDSAKFVHLLGSRDNGGFEMNKDALRKIAEHHSVKDNPVAVISVAGEPNTGKSVLLNFLIAFLESDMDKNWQPEIDLSLTLKWRRGRRVIKPGIWIWSKPYLLRKSDGQQIALLLMETEGSFTDNRSQKDHEIFVYSSIISSVLINNVVEEIGENDLEILDILSGYDREYKDPGDKTYFQALFFLIRYWSANEKYECGIEGGFRYMENEIFFDDDRNAFGDRAVKDRVKNAFDKVKCMLLPFSGLVGDQCQNTVNNEIIAEELDDTFRVHLGNFFHHLLTECTESKRHWNHSMTGQDLVKITDKLYQLLQDRRLLNPITTMTELACLTAEKLWARLFTEYQQQMEERRNCSVNMMLLHSAHKAFKAKAMENFENLFPDQIKHLKSRFKASLESKIDGGFTLIKGKIQNLQTEQRLPEVSGVRKDLEVFAKISELQKQNKKKD